MDPLIEVRDVHFAYPDGTQALAGCSLSIDRGERVALLGPNGAGKTTFALLLNGVLTPTSGSVRIGRFELTKDNLREVRRRVGIVFQDPDDQLFMPTVYEDVAFGPLNLGMDQVTTDLRVTEALDAVGMLGFADRPPHHLSFGQRRRVAVATVLAMEPEVVVLDEPTSNLDPVSRRELHEVLGRLEMTLMIVTHDLPYALQLCPRSVVLNEGAIVADAGTREVLSDTELMRANRLELPFAFDPSLLSLPSGAHLDSKRPHVGRSER